MDFSILKSELEKRYSQIQSETNPDIEKELHYQYKGFQDACLLMGLHHSELAKIENNVTTQRVIQLRDDGGEDLVELSDEERQELEEMRKAFNPFKDDEMSGNPTQ